MRILAVLTVLAIFCMHTLHALHWAGYVLYKDYYASKCIYKDKAKNTCQGSCALKKKTKYVDLTTSGPSEQLASPYSGFEYLMPIFDLQLIPTCTLQFKSNMVYKNIFISIHAAVEIPHPPSECQFTFCI